jgi:hypothetical protein
MVCLDREPSVVHGRPRTRRVGLALVAAVGLLAPSACAAGTAASATVPCTAIADTPWYPDVDALAADATTILVGTVAGVERTDDAADDELESVGTSTVYTVDVDRTVRGDAEPGTAIEVRETCTAESSRTQLAADDATTVLFFTNEYGYLIGQSQGRLVEQADGTFHAEVENLDTPVVTAEDLERIAIG